MSSIRTECLQILTHLTDLGMSRSDLLLCLVKIASPNLPDDHCYAITSELLALSSWFEKKDEKGIREAMEHVPSDAVAFKVFLKVRELVLLLNRMSPLQLLHLSNGVIPPGQLDTRFRFMQVWQEKLQHWAGEKLQELHMVIHSTPVHMERQRMLEYVDSDFVAITCGILKLPLEQLMSFHNWFCSLGPVPLRDFISLLSCTDSPSLIELKAAVNLEHLRSAANNPEVLLPVPLLREDLLSSLTSGFSPPPSIPSHNSGPIKTSVGSLDLGAIPMDLGFNEDEGFGIHRSDSDPLNPLRVMPLSRSGSDPLNQIGNARGDSDSLKVRFPGHMLQQDNLSGSASNNNNSNFGAPPSGPSPSLAAPKMGPTPVVKMARGDDDDDDGDDDGGDEDDVLPPAAFQTAAGSLEGASHFQLRIVVQPAPKTVYQRILRPFPAVLLEGAVPGANFFVEVTLCTNDSEEPLSCLSGAAKVRISNGLFATFKRLKITSTSQQIGSLFRLRFQLKSFNGAAFADVPGVVALSQPVEVFSHTHYLNNKKKGHRPSPPTISDIIPGAVRMQGGCKLVILGSNFVKCPQLKVKIGTIEVPANFHEQGTLWIIVPPLPAGRYPVQASNDGLFWTSSPVMLDYV